MLEVLKLTEPDNLLRSYSQVCRLWSEACLCAEVWISFCEDNEFSLDNLTNNSPREIYRRGVAEHVLLPVLRTEKLDMFDCRTKTVTTVIQFEQGLCQIYHLAAVLLPKNNLLFCGGDTNHACLISGQGSWTHLQNMLEVRIFHSALHYKGTVFVLGGARNTAEKLLVSPLDSAAQTNWQALPNMNFTHVACQPCEYRGQFYLFGGNTDHCEVFCPLSEHFQKLPLVLPESEYGCVGFAEKGEFVILTGHCVIRWRPEEALRVESNPVNIPGIWTCMSQCLHGHFVYSAEKGAIRVFDLDTRVRTAFQSESS